MQFYYIIIIWMSSAYMRGRVVDYIFFVSMFVVIGGFTFILLRSESIKLLLSHRLICHQGWCCDLSRKIHSLGIGRRRVLSDPKWGWTGNAIIINSYILMLKVPKLFTHYIYYKKTCSKYLGEKERILSKKILE